MAPQVTDFDEFLALAAPSTPPHMPPPTSSSSYSSTSQDYDNSNDHYQHDTNDNNSTEPQSSTTLTPVQLVALSNLKLNSDMFSNRSLSIHRRILVKNFLTLLYKLNPPMDWGQMQMEMQQMEYGDDFGQDQGMLLGEDEQDGWMERTLHAAGLNDKDDVDMTAQKRENSVNSSGSTTPASSVGSQSQSSSLAASNSTPSAASDTKVPLPRPRSTELPQSLHSYLSTVFDVDWSVGLANTEDSLFTQAAAASSSSGSNSASLSGSSLSTTTGKRKSVGAASGLSNVSSAFAAESPKPSSAPSTHSRSSTVSTTSSFSSVTSVSSASSVSSAGSNYNAYGLEAGAGSATMKQGEAVGKLVTPSKDISMTGGRTHLARKSSLPSARPSAGNSTNGISNIQNASNRSEGSTHNNGLLPDNKGLPVRKLSINSHAKPMLVPGRRSSLLQTGQMPPALPSSKGGHQSNGGNGNSSLGWHNTRAAGTTAKAQDGVRSPVLSPVAPSLSPVSASLSPASPSTSPSLSPILASSHSLSPSTASQSTTHKPTFSRRTSSLPAERPKPIQRSRSSDNNNSSTVATTTSVSETSIIGLPRPLLSPTLPSTSLPSASLTSATLLQSQQQLASGPYPYARSASDDQVMTRGDSPNSSRSGRSPTLSPTVYTSEARTPIASPAATLSRPSPSYILKASKSSPCLVSGAEDQQNSLGDRTDQPGMPDLYRQQQEHYARQSLYYTQGQPALPQQPQTTSTGFKLLARTSSRRAASSSAGQGAMNISTPLPLLPNTPSYDNNDDYSQGGYENGGHHGENNSRSPYSVYRGGGNTYAQSMSNVSIMSSSSVATSSSARTSRTQVEKNKSGSSIGRWNSMKMILGLRVGQGAKG